MSKRKNTFSIVEVDDETERYFFNGQQVGRGNHDDHGWAGMASLRELLKAISKAVGAEQVEGPDEDGE